MPSRWFGVAHMLVHAWLARGLSINAVCNLQTLGTDERAFEWETAHYVFNLIDFVPVEVRMRMPLASGSLVSTR